MLNKVSIGILYNSVPFQYWKDQIEEWAKTAFPHQWKQLQKIGYTTDEDSHRIYNIDRSIEP